MLAALFLLLSTAQAAPKGYTAVDLGVEGCTLWVGPTQPDGEAPVRLQCKDATMRVDLLTRGLVTADQSASGEGALGHRWEPEDRGAVVATVSGRPIWSDDFRRAALRTTPKSGPTLSADERLEVLQRLIEDEVLAEHALAIGLVNESKIRKVLANTLLRERVYDTIGDDYLAEDALRAYFDAHRDDFVVPEKVHIRQIAIKVDEKRGDDEARELAAQLQAEIREAPERMGALALEHSQGPYARRGGDMGFIAREGKPGLAPEVVERAFALGEGEVAVVQAADAFHILRVEDRREQLDRSFEQMKGSVARKIKSELYQQVYDDYVKALLATHKVHIDKKALGAVEIVDIGRPSASDDGGDTP